MARLGIRRKVIGTLIMVGLFPLGLSLIIILMGGAVMRLTSIRNDYEHLAYDCANQLASSIKGEVDQLRLLSRLPNEVAFVREQNLKRIQQEAGGGHPEAELGVPNASAKDVEHRWPGLADTDPLVRQILHNSVAERLRLLDEINPRTGRQLLVTDAVGQTVSANIKPSAFFQADQDWWRKAYNAGQGRVFMSSVIIDPHDHRPMILLAVPMLDDAAPHRVIGIIGERLYLDFLREPLLYAVDLRAVAGQIYDTAVDRTVVAHSETADPDELRRAEAAFRKDPGPGPTGLLDQFFSDLVIGSAPIPFARIAPADRPEMLHPQWVVIVSKPAQTAMTPVYNLAFTVAGIGAALIVALFVLGVAISNREIIIPIMRLREATAAVGRGELNIRLVDPEHSDSTFRRDEIGDLARDFDEMTRQLQKNVSQLERSNEAKRRFMELAGHELRTPITYILGVCQLLQRQVQLAQKSDDTHAEGSTVTARSTAAMQGAVTKVISKTQRLSRIIENLLKLVNNDQFTTRLVRQPIDMRALLLQVCNDNRPFVLERRQQMQIDVPENLPAFEGDRDKLEDVLTNLVSNAIRFSPDHSTIKVGARAVVGDMLEIMVEDAGPGIPDADLANLFEPFYTGTDIMHHHSGTIEFGSKGIGLGLAIVRRFVEIHGGVVRAHATGHGTQFQILLPLLQGGLDAAPTPPAEGAGI